jgi:hypothetical protein
MTRDEKHKSAILHSVELLEKELKEIEEQLDLDSDTDHIHKTHLIDKRNRILKTIEMGRRLLE